MEPLLGQQQIAEVHTDYCEQVLARGHTLRTTRYNPSFTSHVAYKMVPVSTIVHFTYIIHNEGTC